VTPASREALALLLVGAGLGLGGNALRPLPLPFSAPPAEPSPPEPGADLEATGAADAAQAWRDGAFFLDVRPDAEFEARRVAGALPLPADRLEDVYYETVLNLGTDVPLVVYGAGADSFTVRRVTQYLLDLGHADVACVTDGVDALLAAGIDAGDGPAENLW
jgi:rhodanese-related sulfurtransferase